MLEYSIINLVIAGSSHVAVTKNLDITLVLSKEFPDIKTIKEYKLILKAYLTLWKFKENLK